MYPSTTNDCDAFEIISMSPDDAANINNDDSVDNNLPPVAAIITNNNSSTSDNELYDEVSLAYNEQKRLTSIPVINIDEKYAYNMLNEKSVNTLKEKINLKKFNLSDEATCLLEKL